MWLRGFWSAVCRQLARSVGRANAQLRPSGWICPVLLRGEAPEQPSSSTRCGQAPPNIWFCSDSYETCWADDWNYTIWLPDLDDGRHPLSFVLQNVFLQLSQSQWVQIQREESLGVLDDTNVCHWLPAAWLNTALSILLSRWKLGSSFRVTSWWLIEDV